MILIYKYQRNLGNATCKAHYLKNGKYLRSSDAHPFSNEMIIFLTKGHSKFSIINVMNKTDLSYKEYNKSL